MSLSRLSRAFIAMIAAASMAGCSGAVRSEGPGDDGADDTEGAVEIDGTNGATPDVEPPGIGQAPDTYGACGNGNCNGQEDCWTCPQDCGACAYCGDGACEAGESCSSCSQDCGPCPGCGNGVCSANESCDACPQDCGACACHSKCATGDALDETCSPCVAQICAVDPFCCQYAWDTICVNEVGSVCGTPCPSTCGDSMCDAANEDCSSCVQDCGACPVCGDGWCSWTEDCSTCSQDCGACPTCGDGICEWPESCSICGQDCGDCIVCGDGVCDPAGESCSSCSADCGACPCHDTCTAGEPMAPTCGTCVEQICDVDPFCCQYAWDNICVGEVGSVCGTPCPATCGNNWCEQGEDCSTCSNDCGVCPTCGDGWCTWPEDCSTCSNDCGACAACGNGACESGETCGNCAGDCGACVCHDKCETGEMMDGTCGACEAQICAADSFCCSVSWDFLCVNEVTTICGLTCP